jgi:hypothetical protein
VVCKAVAITRENASTKESFEFASESAGDALGETNSCGSFLRFLLFRACDIGGGGRSGTVVCGAVANGPSTVFATLSAPDVVFSFNLLGLWAISPWWYSFPAFALSFI